MANEGTTFEEVAGSLAFSHLRHRHIAACKHLADKHVQDGQRATEEVGREHTKALTGNHERRQDCWLGIEDLYDEELRQELLAKPGHLSEFDDRDGRSHFTRNLKMASKFFNAATLAGLHPG